MRFNIIPSAGNPRRAAKRALWRELQRHVDDVGACLRDVPEARAVLHQWTGVVRGQWRSQEEGRLGLLTEDLVGLLLAAGTPRRGSRTPQGLAVDVTGATTALLGCPLRYADTAQRRWADRVAQ